ncbi:MAG: aminomethyl transferase family protein, partial [Xanthomonadales bacterium]|nr:aminomethyl transferase family protein [Xanthomonadales bacterium]
DRLVAAGEPLGLKHAGLKALASLRMEKGYRDYGHDIDNMDDPYTTGLGFAVRLDKDSDFIGRQACVERKARGAYPHRLVQILLNDPEPLMIHSEIVLRDGVPVGEVRAASYGHTLGASVGLAMVEGEQVDAAWLESGEWSVDIAGRIYPATVSLKPLYDPGMKRVRS